MSLLSMDSYRHHDRVIWADLHANGHVANTAFLDFEVETQLSSIAERIADGAVTRAA